MKVTCDDPLTCDDCRISVQLNLASDPDEFWFRLITPCDMEGRYVLDAEDARFDAHGDYTLPKVIPLQNGCFEQWGSEWVSKRIAYLPTRIAIAKLTVDVSATEPGINLIDDGIDVFTTAQVKILVGKFYSEYEV